MAFSLVYPHQLLNFASRYEANCVILYRKISSRKFWTEPTRKEFLIAMIMQKLPAWMTCDRKPCGIIKHVDSFIKTKILPHPTDFPEIPANETKLRRKFPNPMVDVYNKDKNNDFVYGIEVL